MKSLRPWLRLILFAFILIWFFLRLIIGSWVKGKSMERGFRIRRKFCKAALRAFNIRVNVSGETQHKSGLFISNHRSMIDPIVELSLLDVYVLSKAEVGEYPLIGKGAKETGVFFVDRDSDNSRKAALQSIEKLLAGGFPILIFPEGTTKAAELTSEFRKGAFEVAQNLKVPVIPVMIEYPDHEYYWTDESLMEYFKKIFSLKGKHDVYVKIGKPITAPSAESLLNTTRAAIDDMIRETKKLENQNLNPTVAAI
jgi:1-acyl-sn-glycerol-3-phosphate acyltransferase